jgi:PEP-CTERM motif
MITIRTIPIKQLFCSTLFLLLGIFQCSQVLAESLFDFNEINAPRRKRQHAAAIDSYMENLYGSEIIVGPKIQLGGIATRGGRGVASLSADSGAFLRNGRGKNSAITLSFDASPISSFSADSQVFKRGVGIVVKADGVIVYQHLLTKAEKRSGIMESIDPILFDTPVQTLEFIGLKRTKIGIDNLRVNLSEDQIGAEPTVAQVPEPSTLLMLGVGFLAAASLARRSTSGKPYRR